jgi:hypothetical protein
VSLTPKICNFTHVLVAIAARVVFYILRIIYVVWIIVRIKVSVICIVAKGSISESLSGTDEDATAFKAANKFFRLGISYLFRRNFWVVGTLFAAAWDALGVDLMSP